MMMLKRTALLAAMVLAGASGPVAAQNAAAQNASQAADTQTYVDPLANNAAALAPAGDTVSQIAFAYADRDEDLLVSWEEYRNRGMRLFEHVDVNKDGILQIAELKAMGGPDAPPAPFDISAATFNAALRKFFDLGDKNRDGALTPAEWRDTTRPSHAF